MKHTFKQLTLALAMLLVSVGSLHAQAALASTTLSAALTGAASSLTPGASTDVIYLTSLASFNWNSAGQLETLLYVDAEAMYALQIVNTTAGAVRVARGASGTQATAHNNGATVWVGPPHYFGGAAGYAYAGDKHGACTATAELVLPYININSGNSFNCIASQWQIINGPAASAVGLTALGPNAAGTVDAGSATLPFRYYYWAGSSGTPATNNFRFAGASAGGLRTWTFQDSSDTVVGRATTDTLTNKTLTSPVLNTATLNGSINSETVKCTTQFDAVTGTTGATLTNVAGMVVTVVPGTYRYYLNIPGVATTNTGVKMAFKLTTTVLTSIEYTARAFTASAVAVTHGTTTSDQTLLMDSAAGAVISTVIEGTVVVGTGGTIQFQSAQHTAHADTVSVYAGASMTFTRIL